MVLMEAPVLLAPLAGLGQLDPLNKLVAPDLEINQVHQAYPVGHCQPGALVGSFEAAVDFNGESLFSSETVFRIPVLHRCGLRPIWRVSLILIPERPPRSRTLSPNSLRGVQATSSVA